MSALVELPLQSYQRQSNLDLSSGGSYSFATAGAMMWLSQLTYEKDEVRKKVLGHWGLDLVAPLQSEATDHSGTRGLVVRAPDCTIVALAGTDPLELKNWRTDFYAVRSQDRDISKGLEAAVDSVKDALEDALRGRDEAHRPLLFTGHSLGAALAVVAAERLRSPDIAAVYTFGMPRCGGERFVQGYAAAGLQQKTYRFVHGDDIVPTVPPPELGFHHVGLLLQCRHGRPFDTKASPQSGQSDQPILPTTLRTILEGMIDSALRGVLPVATQPDLLGQVFRILPRGIGDHIPSQYLHALGFDM
jgi:triacylglycerol lipase